MTANQIAKGSIFIGVIITVFISGVMISDRDFDFLWHWNKYTIMTTFVGFSYGFTFYGIGILTGKSKK